MDSYLISTIFFCHSTETQVLCFPPSTTVGTCPTAEAVNMSYSDCCTQAERRLYQLNDADCTICGMLKLLCSNTSAKVEQDWVSSAELD